MADSSWADCLLMWFIYIEEQCEYGTISSQETILDRPEKTGQKATFEGSPGNLQKNSSFFVTSLASKADALPDSKSRDFGQELLSTSICQRWAKRLGLALNVFEEQQSWYSELNIISALNDCNFWYSQENNVHTRKTGGPLGILHFPVNKNWGRFGEK